MPRSSVDSRLARLRQKLPALVVCFCVLQPLLDVLGFWQNSLKLGNALTLALRLLLLAAMLALGFLLSDRKRCYYWTLLALAAFTGLHVLACFLFPGGYRQSLQDLANLVRIYVLPLTLLCFVTFLRQNEKTYPALLKGLSADLAIIASVQLISFVTKTDPHTYRYEGIGVLGWFLWTNSQSAILSMLLPVTVCWALHRWDRAVLPVAGAAAVAELTLFALAPRLSYACMLAVGFGLGIWIFLFSRPRRKQAAAILLVTLVFLALYPASPTRERRAAAREQIAAGQHNIDAKELPTVQKPAPGESLSQEDLDKFEKIYHSLGTVYSVVERFGLERTLQAYDYSLDASVLGDARLRKITYCRLLMEDAGPLNHWFGLNVCETFQFIPQGFLNEATGVWEDGYESMDVENDFHGIYFLTGITGLCILLALLLYVAVRISLSLFRLRKTEKILDLGAFSAGLVCAVLHAVFTASVLRRNNASVYLAMVLAVLLFLTPGLDQARKKDLSV